MAAVSRRTFLQTATTAAAAASVWRARRARAEQAARGSVSVTLPLATFLIRLEDYDYAWERRVREARQNGRVLRYVASVTRRRIQVGLQAVEPTSPFAALTGTDNQVAFTTMRYKTTPLIITGPGAGPAVTAAGVLNDILTLAAS